MAYGLLTASLEGNKTAVAQGKVLHLFTFPKHGLHPSSLCMCTETAVTMLSVFHIGITYTINHSDWVAELVLTCYNPLLILPIEHSSVMKGKHHVQGC